jgi:uncharacterized protein YjbJ (UPF0337 family)
VPGEKTYRAPKATPCNLWHVGCSAPLMAALLDSFFCAQLLPQTVIYIQEAVMNDDILTGEWKQMKGALKSWWGQFTDDDFNDIGGQKDKLIGWVQENYGRTREQAVQEVDARLKEYSDKNGSTVNDLKAKAYDIGETVVGKAREGATAVRSGMEKTSSYFQEKTFDSIGSDIAALVRKYPVQSVFLGLGVGIWLARGIKR